MEYDPSPDDADQISKLYLGLKEGKITSDLNAAEYIYGKPVIDSKYTTLKNRLKVKLNNLLFFLDIHEPNFSEFAVARYQNAKSLFWLITLLGFGARNSIVKLAERSLRQATKYGLTLNALQFAISLRNYSRFSGSEKQYNKYATLTTNILKTFESEQIALEYYERLTLKFSRSTAEQPDLLDISTEYLQHLEVLKQTCDSFNFYQSYFRVKSIVLQLEQKYNEAVDICEEALRYYDRNKHVAFSLLYGDFYLQELSCFLHLREYEKGKEILIKCEELFPVGGANWFVLMEYRFLLEMQTFHFNEANTTYLTTTSQPRYQFLADETKEKWQLYQLYLDFALRQTESNSLKDEKLRISPERFLKIVPTFKKDKRGYNIAILILHVILLLEQNDFDSIIGRMDALRTYRNRYLQVNTNRRSALFFKMLQIMETNSFDPKLTALKSKRYFQNLTKRTSDAVEAQEALQILPFEWLWETILKMLEQKQKQGIIQKMV